MQKVSEGLHGNVGIAPPQDLGDKSAKGAHASCEFCFADGVLFHVGGNLVGDVVHVTIEGPLLVRDGCSMVSPFSRARLLGSV